MARMLWLMRAAAAITIGTLAGLCLYGAALMALERGYSSQVEWATIIVSNFVVPQAVALGVYRLVSPRGPRTVETETHCRKCGYILRGITKPRCPECGERI